MRKKIYTLNSQYTCVQTFKSPNKHREVSPTYIHGIRERLVCNNCIAVSALGGDCMGRDWCGVREWCEGSGVREWCECEGLGKTT